MQDDLVKELRIEKKDAEAQWLKSYEEVIKKEREIKELRWKLKQAEDKYHI